MCRWTRLLRVELVCSVMDMCAQPICLEIDLSAQRWTCGFRLTDEDRDMSVQTAVGMATICPVFSCFLVCVCMCAPVCMLVRMCACSCVFALYTQTDDVNLLALHETS